MSATPSSAKCSMAVARTGSLGMAVSGIVLRMDIIQTVRKRFRSKPNDNIEPTGNNLSSKICIKKCQPHLQSQSHESCRVRLVGANFRPAGAWYLAQGKRYSAPPWGQEFVIKFSRLEGARYCTVLSLALTGRQASGVPVKSFTQGGGEYALPWARYQAPSGRNTNVHATLSLMGKTGASAARLLRGTTEPAA